MDFVGPMMMNGGAYRAPDFTLSGGWETDLEGWTTPGGYIRENFQGRGSSWALRGSGANGPYYTLPAAMIEGMSEVFFEIYARKLSGGDGKQYGFGYSINGVETIISQTQATTGSAFTWLRSVDSAQPILVTPGEDLTIYLFSQDSVAYFDDWMITSIRP